MVRGRELFDDWKDQIGKLKTTVDVWDWARAGDVDQLARYFLWSPRRDCVFHSPLPDQDSIDDEVMDEVDEPDRFSPGDVVGPALAWVGSQFNLVLGEGVVDHTTMTPRLEYDPQEGTLALRFVPRNLLAGVWFQLAQSISGDREHRQCLGCGTWFELDPGVTRNDRQTCSDRCRARIYRERKDRAVQLADEGKTPKEIATELDSDVKRVKGWIKQRKG
jgi:hypothetical protein